MAVLKTRGPEQEHRKAPESGKRAFWRAFPIPRAQLLFSAARLLDVDVDKTGSREGQKSEGDRAEILKKVHRIFLTGYCYW